MPPPSRHLERIDWVPRRDVDLDGWPYRIPAVRQLIDEGGFEVPPGVTVLIGENGSGKSTLVEAFAAVYPRHGAESSQGQSMLGPAASAEDSPLRWQLRARTHRLAAPGGFVLRSSWASGACAGPGGRNWTSLDRGGTSSTALAGGCVTS